jgi:hypothetical protein
MNKATAKRLILVTALQVEVRGMIAENKQRELNGFISRLPNIEIGDKIKLYGRITTVVGFNVLWNDDLEDYEIILLTTGRGDPFKRSLKQIELVQND